jgi:hypothetical protein
MSTVIAILLSVIQAQALTVAVFPLEDLSQGFNSPNIKLTQYLADQLVAKGLVLVEENDIIAYMAKERVRWLGYLDTDLVIKAQKSLGADFILLGTIIQRQKRNSPSFGLTLHLVRTRDAKTLWSSTAGLSLVDMQRLLGLNEPKSLDDLMPALVNNLLADWPANLDNVISQKLIFDSEAGELSPMLQVKGINLRPRFVRPGDQVKCAVELDSTVGPENSPQIFIKVGSRVHLAQQTQEGLFYEAAWTGSEIEKGIFREVGHEALNLATNVLDAQYFEGVWPGPIGDDTYPVSLILRWPTGAQQEAFVGNYTVDSTPPDIDMILKNQQKLNGLPTFNDKIFILPDINRGEPTSHWRISVEDSQGRRVKGDEGNGRMPKKFWWDGFNFNGFPVEEGVYRLILEVWDRAGNRMETYQEVAYKPKPPDIIMEVEKVKHSLQLELDLVDKEIPLRFWRMELWSADGEYLLSADGTELPASYGITIPTGPEKAKIEGFVTVRDILGNQTRMDIADLYIMAMKDGRPDMQDTSEADKEPERKDDSWVLLPDF